LGDFLYLAPNIEQSAVHFCEINPQSCRQKTPKQ
jgi:hypothetical protein